MDGYTDSTYGDAFADVYDDWYHDISDVGATVDLLADLAARGRRPCRCSSSASAPAGWPFRWPPRASTSSGSTPARRCSSKLAEQRPDAASVAAVLGDMVDDQPDGPFASSSWPSTRSSICSPRTRQQACFAAVAERLAPGGAFVVEAFVPEPQPGSSVVVRSMTADSVVLSVTTHDDDVADRAGSVHLVQRSQAACDCGRGRSATRPSSNSTRWRRASGFRRRRTMGRCATSAVHRRQSTSRVGVSHNSQPRPS